VQEQVDELTAVVFGCMLARSGAAGQQAQVGVGEHVHGQAQLVTVGFEQVRDGLPGGGLRAVAARGAAGRLVRL
jgi:hypothetical protein